MPESINDLMRIRLLELQNEIEAITATSEESSQVVELDQAKVGRLSRMDALQAQQMAIASGRRREMRVKQIILDLTLRDRLNYYGSPLSRR